MTVHDHCQDDKDDDDDVLRGHHLPPWSLEAVLEAFFDRDLACTLACLFFSSDLANFLPQESHVNGFSPAIKEMNTNFSITELFVGKTVN